MLLHTVKACRCMYIMGARRILIRMQWKAFTWHIVQMNLCFIHAFCIVQYSATQYSLHEGARKAEHRLEVFLQAEDSTAKWKQQAQSKDLAIVGGIYCRGGPLRLALGA